ncbi:MAG: insulinase family protein [Bacteroidetes bacterium]|nr:insulinase family protein [Bacteroidota bacterium]
MRNILITFVILFTAFSVKAQIDRTHAPNPDSPKKLDVGVLIPIEMDNGLQVYLAPIKNYPKFTLSVNIEQPNIYDDERQEESGILTKAYYKKLSEKYPNGQIDSLVRLKGAMLSATTRGGTIKGMNRDIDVLLDLYTDLLFNPLIKEEYIEDKKEQYKKSQENKTEQSSVFSDKQFVLERLVDSLLHGEAKEEEKKKEIIQNYDNITIEVIEDFIQKRIVANNSVIVLIGDFSEKNTAKLMKKYFGKWQQGEPIEKEIELKSSKSAIEKRRIVVLDKPNAVQSKIRFQWILGDAYAYGEHAVKIEVLNEILGESQLSYLYKNLREDKGLCYFVGSSIVPDDNGGRASIWMSVRTDQTAYAIENILLEMLRIRNFDVSDHDLKVAKSSLIGEFTRSLSGIAPVPYISFAMIKETYNLPDDYLQTKVSKYYEVNTKDIREMAERYVKPFKNVLVITGKASELHGTLEKFGEVTYLDEDGNELIFEE